MKKTNYLAYGSNMDLEQMAYRCQDAELIGACLVEDYRLLFRGSKTGSYATIEPFKGSRVPALIWSVSENDEYFLDRYEGYPRFYDKQTIEAQMPDGPIDAMVYTLDETHPLGEPSEYYYDVLERAYVAFEFDLDILCQALSDSI